MRTATAFLSFVMTGSAAFAQPNAPADLRLSPAERGIARAKQFIEKNRMTPAAITHLRSRYPAALAKPRMCSTTIGPKQL